MWTPTLRPDGPRYLALADRIQADVESGRLRAGAQLPPQRALAASLGVDFTTVTRAYAEARRRGLVRGHVGRGTFVRERTARERTGRERVARGASARTPQELVGQSAAPDGPVDLSLNFPPLAVLADAEAMLARTLAELPETPGFAGLLQYQPNAGRDDHRAAGASWIARRGLAAPAAQVVVTSGAQHALAVLLTTLAARGDTVLTESFTYPVFRVLADQLGLRLRGLPMDDEGITPDGLRDACLTAGRAGAPRLLYCTPTLQNPTTAVMSAARRAAIADVARAHDLTIVEDDTYGPLAHDAPPALATWAPERTYFVASLSKTVAPGLRTAFLAAPNATAAARLAAGIRATAWMATPLTAEVAASWIRDGTALRLLEANRAEAAVRQRIAARCLTGLDWRAHPEAYHGWLALPPAWSVAELVVQLGRDGIVVTPGESFHVGDGPAPTAIRLSLSGAPSTAALERALGRVAATLGAGPGIGASVI